MIQITIPNTLILSNYHFLTHSQHNWWMIVELLTTRQNCGSKTVFFVLSVCILRL